MPQTILQFFDSIFPVREESRDSRLAMWLDRAICFFIALTALAAPVSIAATNAGWIGGVFCWILRLLVRPRPRFFRSPIDFAILGFWGWSLLSCIFSYAPDLSFDRLRVLTLFPIAYLVAQNVRHPKTVKFLVGALILATMATVIWSFAERGIGRGVQIFGVKPDGALARAGIKDGDTLLKINGKRFWQPETLADALHNGETVKINIYRPDYYFDAEISGAKLSPGASLPPTDALGFERWQRGRNWRSAGFYSHYTTYAEVLQLVMSLVFGIFIVLLTSEKVTFKRKSWTRTFFTLTAVDENPQKHLSLSFGFWQLILFVCLIAMGVALLLTATRASQAAFALSVLAIIFLGTNRQLLLLSLSVFLLLAIGAGFYLQQSRNVGFVDPNDNSTTWRMTVYREGGSLLFKSPRHLLVGVGIDAVKRFKCDWGLFADCTLPAGHFHSTPLQIAVESGLPALFLWLLVVWRFGKSLFLTIRQNGGDAVEKGILLGIFGGLIGFLASGAVHYNLGDSEVAMTFFFLMGLGLVLIRQIKSDSAVLT